MSTGGLASGRRGMLVAACLLFLVVPGSAQHAGLRQQWQPQTEGDPRLQQRVETELVCISAQRGLPLLAEKTGVSLAVAPEDLATVGERKLTVIAKGCTLKEVMVQLCEALRECHWDVDASGAQPAYLLHRNAGVEAAERERQEGVRAEAAARRREERIARVEAARRALAMTPEEAAELEKTDLLLARALRYPPTRDAMEAFFSLPPERVQEFAETGGLRLQFSEFSPKAQQLLLAAVRAEIAWAREYLAEADAGHGMEEAKEQLEAFARALPQSLEQAAITARYSTTLGLTLFANPVSAIALPPRYGRPTSEIMRHLLEATGDTTETATQALTQQWERRQRQRTEEEQQRLRARVLAPEVEQPPATPFDRLLRLSALEKATAEQTGLSLVADAFWSDQFEIQMDKPAHPASVREALDTAASWGAFEWSTVGRCLVLRHKGWYEHAQRDVPESMVLRYRQKLRTQGRFTLDDAAALACELSGTPGSRLRGPMELPEDLSAAGLGSLLYPYFGWAPALLASLTPEQRAQAEGAEGLRLAELSQAQRDKALRLAGEGTGRGPEESAAVFRITKSEGREGGRRYTQYDLRLQWGPGEYGNVTAWVQLFEGGRTGDR